MNLYTNTKSRNDFIRNAILQMSRQCKTMMIASAFFTDAELISDLASKGITINLVVRLGFPTSPTALRSLIQNNNVNIRFFTDESFHPKLIIFDDDDALIGSANLTKSGIDSNQEIMVSVNSDDDAFIGLIETFNTYWMDAKVLTNEYLNDYQKIYREHDKINKEITSLNNKVLDKIGVIRTNNITTDVKIKGSKSIFTHTYQQNYQSYRNAFNKIQSIYQEFTRKTPDNVIPLRLEIDSFFSFVKDKIATGETWKDTKLGFDNNINTLRANISEWLKTYWPHYEEKIIPINYPLIQRSFSSPDKIKSLDYDQIIETLMVLHSLHDRYRFYKGGKVSQIPTFIELNPIDCVKISIVHLLYGRGDIVSRMADLIYDSNYKLNHFGNANVQELVGWVNKEEYPIINGRTTKILRFYGFDVKQL